MKPILNCVSYGLCLLGAIFFVTAPLAFASVSYTVSPLVINTEVEARDIISRSLTLTNTGTAPVTIYPTVNNIAIDAGGIIQEFISPSMSDRTNSLAAWIEISRAGIDLRVGESTTVTLTLRIPPNPVPGTYHALIGFGYGETRPEAERQVETGQAPGTIVSLTIVDKKREFLKLSRFNIARFITSVENQAASYIINNPGETPLTPKGDIIIYDNRGAEVLALAVNREQISIPPGENHTFTIEVPITSLFGKYKAFLDVEYGDAQRGAIQDTAFFYVFPMRVIGPAFALFAILAIILALFVHKRYVSDDDIDPSGAEYVHLTVRESQSESCEHDIDLKQKI